MEKATSLVKGRADKKQDNRLNLQIRINNAINQGVNANHESIVKAQATMKQYCDGDSKIKELSGMCKITEDEEEDL